MDIVMKEWTVMVHVIVHLVGKATAVIPVSNNYEH